MKIKHSNREGWIVIGSSELLAHNIQIHPDDLGGDGDPEEYGIYVEVPVLSGPYKDRTVIVESDPGDWNPEIVDITVWTEGGGGDWAKAKIVTKDLEAFVSWFQRTGRPLWGYAV
jgi:hypothetical protein